MTTDVALAPGPRLWRMLGWVIVITALSPVLALLAISTAGALQVSLGPHALGLLANTLAIGLGTAALSVALGVSCAWLVEVCEFPFRRALGFLLFMPFAIPPYLSAYIWADIVDDGGWLPAGWGLRNPVGACVVMALVFYPYAYMLSRAAFAHLSCNLLAASRLLGCTPRDAFIKIALPLARPAIAIGAMLAFMEATNDIAIAEDYGLSTLSHHIYDVWLNRDDQHTATAYAVLLMALALCLAGAEHYSRRRQRQYELTHSNLGCWSEFRLSGFRGATASLFCLLVASLGFLVPVAFLVARQQGGIARSLQGVAGSLADTLAILASVVVTCCLFGMGVSMLRRALGSLPLGVACRLTVVGYAFPGVIYALGALVAVGWLAGAVDAALGVSIHWMWTTSTVLLVAALSFRYLVVTSGATDAALASLPPHYGAVCKNAGKSRLAALWQVHLPLMRPMLVAGLLLLMVDVIKELPLTLVLRPLGTTTLALDVYQHAADEDLGSASVPALALVLLAVLALTLVYRWVVPAWRASVARPQQLP